MELTRRQFMTSAASAFGLLVVGRLPDLSSGMQEIESSPLKWRPMLITVGGLPFDMIAHDYIEDGKVCEVEAHVKVPAQDVAQYHAMCRSIGIVDVEVDTRQRVKISGQGQIKSECIYVWDYQESMKIEVTILMNEQMEVEILWR